MIDSVKPIAWLLCLLLIILAPNAAAQVVELGLEASADNSIYQDDVDHSNGQGEFLFAGRIANGQRRRALLRFEDLSSIPSDAIVISVELELFLSRLSDTAGPLNLFLHRLETAWGEGDSNAGSPGGLGTDAAVNDATWDRRFFPDTNWTSPGSDFVDEPSSQVLVFGVDRYRWPNSAAMRADLNLWRTQPNENHGWVLLDSLTAPLRHARRFNSRENTDQSTRPRLLVRYEVPLFVDGFE